MFCDQVCDVFTLKSYHEVKNIDNSLECLGVGVYVAQLANNSKSSGGNLIFLNCEL